MSNGEREERHYERTERSRGDGPSGGSDRARRQALSVVVDERGIDAAVRTFKKIVMKEGLLKEIKRHEFYEKPGDRKRRKRREAIRRRRRQEARARARLGDRE